MRRPLVIELFAGSFGWGAGFVVEGWRSIGFDILHGPYHGPVPEHCELVLQDVLTLHGSQFKHADAIVASPPCTEYSYMAMPWSRAKAISRALRGKGEFPEGYTGSRTIAELNVLFDACFRIQREASEAAGRYIPMVVENVKGAQPWVGRAKAHYGSFYLWGDVESIGNRIVRSGRVEWGMAAVAAAGRGSKLPGNNGPRMWSEREVQRLCDATKNNGGSWFNQSHNTSGEMHNPVNNEVKVGGISFSGYGTPGYKPQGFNTTAAKRYREGLKDRDSDGYERNHPNALGWKAPRTSSRSNSRKAASAQIAKIPFELARHIARTFYPQNVSKTD